MEDIGNYGYTLFRTIPQNIKNGACIAYANAKT